MEKRERVEITFSFDTEDEANAWITTFKEASKDYQDKINSNRDVPVEAGSGSLENNTEKEGAEEGV